MIEFFTDNANVIRFLIGFLAGAAFAVPMTALVYEWLIVTGRVRVRRRRR